MRSLSVALCVALVAPLCIACQPGGLSLSLVDGGVPVSSPPCYTSSTLNSCAAAQARLASCCAPDGGNYPAEAGAQTWCELMELVAQGDAGPGPECIRLAGASCEELIAAGVCR